MKSVLVTSIALALLAFIEPASIPDSARYEGFSGEVFGKSYRWSFTEGMFRKAPLWKDDVENPPVPAGQAIKLATRMKDSLVKDSDGFKWQLKELQLQPMGNGRWFWFVSFEALREDGSGGGEHTLGLVVLMDGTVVKPRVIVH